MVDHTCKHFSEVQCGQRFEPVAPCMLNVLDSRFLLQYCSLIFFITAKIIKAEIERGIHDMMDEIDSKT